MIVKRVVGEKLNRLITASDEAARSAASICGLIETIVNYQGGGHPAFNMFRSTIVHHLKDKIRLFFELCSDETEIDSKLSALLAQIDWLISEIQSWDVTQIDRQSRTNKALSYLVAICNGYYRILTEYRDVAITEDTFIEKCSEIQPQKPT